MVNWKVYILCEVRVVVPRSETTGSTSDRLPRGTSQLPSKRTGAIDWGVKSKITVEKRQPAVPY
jgi:hypothetical protein